MAGYTTGLEDRVIANCGEDSSAVSDIVDRLDGLIVKRDETIEELEGKIVELEQRAGEAEEAVLDLQEQLKSALEANATP